MDAELVQTKLGPGEVAVSRDDGFVKVELEWQLERAKGFLYVKRTELTTEGRNVQVRSYDATLKLHLGNTLFFASNTLRICGFP